eukprot:1196070-Prorocentrum_minimum.AAC.4
MLVIMRFGGCSLLEWFGLGSHLHGPGAENQLASPRVEQLEELRHAVAHLQKMGYTIITPHTPRDPQA